MWCVLGNVAWRSPSLSMPDHSRCPPSRWLTLVPDMWTQILSDHASRTVTSSRKFIRPYSDAMSTPLPLVLPNRPARQQETVEGGVVQFPYRIGILPTAQILLIQAMKSKSVAKINFNITFPTSVKIHFICFTVTGSFLITIHLFRQFDGFSQGNSNCQTNEW